VKKSEENSPESVYFPLERADRGPKSEKEEGKVKAAKRPNHTFNARSLLIGRVDPKRGGGGGRVPEEENGKKGDRGGLVQAQNRAGRSWVGP